jgi:protoheme IX farnesyltransferase
MTTLTKQKCDLLSPTYQEQESRLIDFISLLKPRVMSLVVFTGWIGLVLSPTPIHPFIGVLVIFCIALGSGASGAINMWYDRDIDIIMTRTNKRPIPAKRIAPDEALFFGITTALFSVLILGLATNLLSALLLASAILFYVFIYTMWLKRRTPQNIVIGGAAGSFPPLIGWVSATGSISIEPLLLFLIIFLWTPPHFWALALYRNDDYQRANIPMLPVVSGERSTKNHIVIYSILLVISSLSLVVFGNMGTTYLVISTILNSIFLWHAFRVLLSKNTPLYAPKMFGFSIIYLFLLFCAMYLDLLIK